MTNKLYHHFRVYSYKGGELSSNINQTIEDMAFDIVIDWGEISDRCADEEKFANMTVEEFSSLSRVQLLDMVDDEILKDIATDNFYPGNIYAYDTVSDSEVYTINDKGELVLVDNIVEESGFIEAFRKYLRKDAEWHDERKKNSKNEK